MSIIAVDTVTGAFGGAAELRFVDQLVLTDEQTTEIAESGVFPDLTPDQESETITFSDVVALLREVQEQKGDWRGTLDYVIHMLTPEEIAIVPTQEGRTYGDLYS